MFTIEKPTVENILSSTMESGLGLDISKTSTGIMVFENGETNTYQSVIEYDEESELHYYHMVKALEEDLLYVAEGKHFDIIAIEDAIQGENFDTVRKLILLNSVIDKLIAEGKITCNYFDRINNQVWKKWLRTLRPGKHYQTDKIEIEEILLMLEYSFAVENQHLSKREKEKTGYQDQLDATGVLIGAGLRRQNEKVTPKKKKKLPPITVELYDNEEIVLETYKNYNITRIQLGGNLNASVNSFFKDLSDADRGKAYYMVLESLGTLGLSRDIMDLENKLNYVVVHQLSL